MNLLTTYTHDSELQAIAAPPLISTIHKSPQHPLSLLLQPAASLPVVLWQRLLTMEILQLQALMSSLHSLQYRNYSHLCSLIITYRHGPHRKQLCYCWRPTVALLRICHLAKGTCLLSRCPETGAI
jgi:hypothetical protein